MNILLLGSGGREHAFAWRIRQNPLCTELFIAPGNAGTTDLGTNLSIDPNDFESLKEVCLEENVTLLIVGPEAPLVNGIYDFFKSDPQLQDILVLGPSKAAAQLEGSKAFAKAFMEEFGIPTARYREFTQDNLKEGLNYIDQLQPPVVLKADGLAAGKGVLILSDIEEAKTEFQAMLEGKFGAASEKVVIEDFLDGIEFSVFVLTDGKSYKVLPIAKDYKRIGEGDTGLNTGGMGAVSPVPFVSPELMAKVDSRIIQPTIKGIQERGFAYEGFVFLGLILVNNEPFVIEYNCRMGDPETQVVFPRIKNDLLDLLLATVQGDLASQEISLSEKAAAAVILVAGGYPEKYEKGKLIEGEDQVDGSLVFHAGTKKQGEKIYTNGGRVIAITSLAENFQDALAQSYQNAEHIDYEGKYYRRDIGFDL